MISFFVENWQYIVSGGAALLSMSYLLINILNARKLRLEIQKLKRELEQQQSSRISTATLDEIAEFASKNPSSRKVRKFIQMKLSSLQDEGSPIALPEAKASQIISALAFVERRLSTEGLEHLLFGALAFLVYLPAAISIVDSFAYFNHDSLLFVAAVYGVWCGISFLGAIPFVLMFD